MSRWFAIPALLLALPLCAQWPGENLVGVQVRAGFPGADLPDAVGSEAPGIGASIQAELHTEPYRFDRAVSLLCARVELGADTWRKPGGSRDRSVNAYHLGVDAVYFLKDDGREFLNGPYLVGGAEGIAWVVGAGASDTGVSQRTLRAGYSVGFGCRFNQHLDAEVKVMASEVDPALKVGVAMVCLNYWF
jgi:hypothetical protein